MMASVFDDIIVDGAARMVTKAEVRSRMQRLVPKAWRTLEYNLDAEDEKVQVAAATAILDRAGYGPQSKVTVEESSEDLTNLTTEELRERALAIAKQLTIDGPQQKTPFDDVDGSVH